MTVLYAGPADTQYDGVSFDMGLERQGTQPKDAIMLFSVIYSVDVPQDEDILSFAPPNIKDLWQEIEDDSQYEYSYLEGCWTEGHHRKWCVVLTREQFDEFIDRCGLIAESTETMGSIGAPGFGIGWSPAISFRGDDPDAIQNAYVTPLPEVSKGQCDEDDWRRVKSAVLAVYG